MSELVLLIAFFFLNVTYDFFMFSRCLEMQQWKKLLTNSNCYVGLLILLLTFVLNPWLIVEIVPVESLSIFSKLAELVLFFFIVTIEGLLINLICYVLIL